MLFTELPFEDRFGAARDAGFRAVEFSFPASVEAKDIYKYLRRYELVQALATVPVREGSKGFAAVPGKQSQFREDFKRGLEYAAEAGCPLLHPLSGVIDTHNHNCASECFVENMSWSVEEAESCGIKIVVEAINQVDVPGYFIRSWDDACRWARQVDGLGLILDLYHASMEAKKVVSPEGLLVSQVDHVQIAGFPGRNEPDEAVLSTLSKLDLQKTQRFAGWVGCEYAPARGTLAGLGWLRSSSDYASSNRG
tara:strand:- start:1983 stop:2738 length:756 start_codon:yes stop_codon:yes gene_type:complete